MEGKLLPQALIAQSVERMAFNHVVVGSSPTESDLFIFIKIILNIFEIMRIIKLCTFNSKCINYLRTLKNHSQ